MASGKKSDALPELDSAYAQNTDPSTRFDILALSARTAADLGDAGRSESYMAKADAEYPDQPGPGLLRHFVAVEHGNDAAADAAADSLMGRYATSPTVVRSLVGTWFTAGKSQAASGFLLRSIAKAADEKALGTLKFYFAVLLSQGEPSADDRARALTLLDQAAKHFQAVFAPTDDVFSVIDDMKKQLQAPAVKP
jgi:uncharacterized protein HemY